MVVHKTYKYNGVDAFTILLKQSLLNGNQIHTTLPQEFLIYHLKFKLLKIRNAYIPTQRIGISYIDDLAKRIMFIPEVEQLFFPSFVRFGKEVNEDTVFKIISKNNNLRVWPNTHYCIYNQELDFYVMKCMYFVERSINNPNMNDVSLEEFRDYLISTEMKLDFDRLYFPGNKAYQIIEDGELRYLLLVNNEEELLMVISL